jgi:hypothetical protein
MQVRSRAAEAHITVWVIHYQLSLSLRLPQRDLTGRNDLQRISSIGLKVKDRKLIS